MIENFDIIQSEDAAPVYDNPFAGLHIPAAKHHKHHKGHKPKGKRELKEALKKAERERDQLLCLIGQLGSENKMMRRAIALAIAANRRQLDDDLAENALRLLPPKRRREEG